MKSLIAALVLVTSNAFAGTVGHIHFQADSTWVNAYTSRTLCFDGDSFKAQITKCADWSHAGEGSCRKEVRVTISQPKYSTAERCVRYQGEGSCSQFETYDYVQSENVKVSFTDRNGNVTGTTMVTVPACK